jgi:vancomycin resistance protein YoaR
MTLRVLVTLVLLLLIGAIGSLIALNRAYSGRIIPNVAVQGIRLDQMQPDAARELLHRHYAAFLATPVLFVFEERTWQPTAAEIGLSLDIEAAVDRAYTVGRGADLYRSLPDTVNAWQDGVELPIHLTVDQHRLQAYLINMARELEEAPQNADVSVLNGQVLRTPEQIGRQVLVDETVQDVLAGLPSLQPQTVTLRTRLLRPLVEESGVVETQRQLEALLGAPVTLTAGERRWTWNQAALGDLMRLSRVTRTDTTGQRIEATLDRRLLERHLTALAQEIDVAPVEPRVHFGANGLQITQPGREGARLETAQALEQLLVVLWQTERTFALPVTVLQPQARPDTLASLGIVELVAQGKSSFEASAAYRIQNIHAGARQIEDVLIAPGAGFSFNQTVGAIDETNGFTQGYAIIDGRTQLEWGGGVCQVSTTVFRAAYWAGVPITERNQHSFRIRWYEEFEPIGMDAAIFTGPGGYDFRFVNDTGRWLLMETVVDTANEVLTVNLYGTHPNREVVQMPPTITNEIPAPTKPRYVNDPKLPAGTIKQTDTARGGMDVRVGRLVKQDGKLLYEDTFFSRFQPWPNIYIRGTGR